MEVVTGALPSLLPKLADLLVGEYNLQKEVKGGIRFLQTELETMKAALEEISDTPPDKLKKVDRIWARDVRELSYDIEDQIDTFMVRCKGRKLQAEQHGVKKAIDWCHKLLMQPKIRRKIAIDIRDIRRSVLEVHERRRRYELDNHSVDKQPVTVDPRALVRYEDVTKLVDINETRDEVIKILTQGNQASKQQDKIVSIVGFGGLGKTTLANVVYQNLRPQFDCSAFVPVSQTPDMEKLFNNLLYQLGNKNSVSIDNAIDELREFLRGKRYFIVIDDIWDISVWETIRCALPDNNVGSKIITTTRILKVAGEIGGAYKMKPLCLESSRILLYRRIFGNEGKDKCPDDELAKVSDRILTKCAGVPLAIITIASLLASKRRNKLDWFEVYNSIGTSMEFNADVENMRKILSLSYHDLPSYLRTCLLYLSVFPEDYKIEKNRLIWMWIAEGFIECGKERQSPFEVGESHFNELINRSMIQPVYDDDGIEILSCRVHDMVLGLIRSLSSEENFISTLNDVGKHTTSPAQKVRRLSIQNENDKVDHGAMTSMQQVRSLVAFSSAVDVLPPFSRLEVVRVLCLEYCDLSHSFYDLRSIGKLVHLRCLGLRSTKIVQLPEEMGNLQLVQMLDISNNKISTLPPTFVQVGQLKCLYIGNRDRLMWLVPNGFGCLTSLEELSLLHIGDMGTIQELGRLTELRVLHIKYDMEYGMEDQQQQQRDVLVECLHKLQKIETLYIDFFGDAADFEGWVFGPLHLRSLRVDDLSLSKLPAWIINPSRVQDLSFLKIRVKELQQEDLQNLGRLPALRHLHMRLAERPSSDISRKFVIGAGSFPSLLHCVLAGYFGRVVFRQGAMPRLTSLKLRVSYEVWSTWNLTGIPDLGFENLPSLQDLLVGLQRGSYFLEAPKAALRNMAEIHPNHPSVSASDYLVCY